VLKINVYTPMNTDSHSELVHDNTPEPSETTLIPWCIFGPISG
jgi:hypothetical protein